MWTNCTSETTITGNDPIPPACENYMPENSIIDTSSMNKSEQLLIISCGPSGVNGVERSDCGTYSAATNQNEQPMWIKLDAKGTTPDGNLERRRRVSTEEAKAEAKAKVMDLSHVLTVAR